MTHPFIGKGAIAYWSVWVAIIAIHTAILTVNYNIAITYSLLDGLIFNLLTATLGLSLWFVIKYTATQNTNSFSSLFSLATSIVFAAIICANLGAWIIGQIDYQPTHTAFVDATIIPRIILNIFYLTIILFVYFRIRLSEDIRTKEESEAKLQNLLKQSELDVLKSQINPHFIFNSLNSISSLTTSSPSKAQEMVIKLSEFLRFSLGQDSRQLHKLEQEFYQMNLYLDIEKIRFGDRLQLNNHCEELCQKMVIPSMILQPLYENAIKYAIYEHTGDVSIDTYSSCKNNHLTITISNSYSSSGSIRKGKGIGLSNVKSRLALIYGKQGLLKIEQDESTFKVTLNIPQIKKS